MIRGVNGRHNSAWLPDPPAKWSVPIMVSDSISGPSANKTSTKWKTKMRKLLLATALTLAATPSFAWDTTNNNAPTSTAYGGLGGAGGMGGTGGTGVGFGGAGGTGGNAAAVSSSAARGGTARAAVVNNISGGNSNGNNWHIPPATAAAPSFAQFNNCSGSPITGAVQSGVFGLSFGTGNHFDEVCRLHMLGLDNVAFAYLCRVDHDVRKAARDAGYPCPDDQVTPEIQPVQVPTVPDWCSHLSNSAERSKYENVCALPGEVRIPGTPVPITATYANPTRTR